MTVAKGRVGSALDCPRGFGYCDNYGKCCDLDYQCADQSQCFGGQPDNALHCPRGFGYCPGLGCCDFNFGCEEGHCFGGSSLYTIPHCPRGFVYCINYSKCCDLDYQCANPTQCF
jgi:hypothetical protein